MDRIEWHPGFQAGLELRLRLYKEKLTFRHELPLSKKPIVVDSLVIEKEDNVEIQDDIAAIFRRYNIFEYKNPDDALSIDEYFDLIAYMARYKSGARGTNAIRADQLTGTLMRQRAPHEMFREIERLGGSIKQRYPGIYHIRGLVFMPTQVIAQAELQGPENAVLRLLTRNASENDVRLFARESNGFIDRQDRSNADAVFQVSVPANRKLYEWLRSDDEVCTALRELLKDDIDLEIKRANEAGRLEGRQEGRLEGRQEGRLEGRREGRLEGRQEGFTRAIVDLIRDNVLSREAGAARLNISVAELDALMARA